MEIHPFRGWRYSTGPEGDVTSFIAPPYDVLTQRDKDDLLARSDRNIVAVDLPHVPPNELGPDEAYQQAASTMDDWRCSGVLLQEPSPAIYAYEQSFSWAGKSYSRRGMICAIRASEPGGDVIPHEHTFAGPRADRLKLTEYTRMQISPILGFFDDPQSTVESLLWQAAEGTPTAQGQLHEVVERLWPVTNEGVIGEIAAAVRDVPVFIADGHHRYMTALSYAASLRAGGQSDDDHEANFVMFCVVSRRDPGLLVLPTHRVISGLSDSFTVPSLVKKLVEFDWQRCSVDDADLHDADSFLRRYGKGAMAFIGAEPAEIWIGRLRDPEAMAVVAGEEIEARRGLDVSVLHKLVIDKALDSWRTDGLSMDYTPDGKTVLAACQSGRAQLGVCLRSTPLEAIQQIAQAGATMPHKSTYFYPKLATGMVLKALE